MRLIIKEEKRRSTCLHSAVFFFYLPGRLQSTLSLPSNHLFTVDHTPAQTVHQIVEPTVSVERNGCPFLECYIVTRVTGHKRSWVWSPQMKISGDYGGNQLAGGDVRILQFYQSVRRCVRVEGWRVSKNSTVSQKKFTVCDRHMTISS